jgi:hypothetical protein
VVGWGTRRRNRSLCKVAARRWWKRSLGHIANRRRGKICRKRKRRSRQSSRDNRRRSRKRLRGPSRAPNSSSQGRIDHAIILALPTALLLSIS